MQLSVHLFSPSVGSSVGLEDGKCVGDFVFTLDGLGVVGATVLAFFGVEEGDFVGLAVEACCPPVGSFVGPGDGACVVGDAVGDVVCVDVGALLCITEVGGLVDEA